MEKFYARLYDILGLLHGLNNPSINKTLKLDTNTYRLGTVGPPLACISRVGGSVLGRSIDARLLSETKADDFCYERTQLAQLINVLKPSVTGLNHLGIGYQCADLSDEIKTYILERRGTGYDLYNEASGSASLQWLFIGNAQVPSTSLFEIVLSETERPRESAWYPHFQIDLDTSMSPNDLAKYCRQILGNKSISWKLHIPKYGTVLYMLRIGRLNGINLYLGLGTNLRDTKYTREYELQLVE